MRGGGIQGPVGVEWTGLHRVTIVSPVDVIPNRSRRGEIQKESHEVSIHRAKAVLPAWSVGLSEDPTSEGPRGCENKVLCAVCVVV